MKEQTPLKPIFIGAKEIRNDTIPEDRWNEGLTILTAALERIKADPIDNEKHETYKAARRSRT